MSKSSEDRHINAQAKKDFEDAKAKFAGFKEIDWVTPEAIIIADGALPKITSEQADKNINDAMERLYGKEDEDTKPGLDTTTFKLKVNKDQFPGV